MLSENEVKHRSLSEKSSMKKIRKEIDLIDKELVSLLAKRQRCVEMAALTKNERSQVVDLERIEEIIDKVKEVSTSSGLSVAIAEPLWRKLIDLSIEHEYAEFDKK